MATGKSPGREVRDQQPPAISAAARGGEPVGGRCGHNMEGARRLSQRRGVRDERRSPRRHTFRVKAGSVPTIVDQRTLRPHQEEPTVGSERGEEFLLGETPIRQQQGARSVRRHPAANSCNQATSGAVWLATGAG
jgi:hypothetical protein